MYAGVWEPLWPGTKHGSVQEWTKGLPLPHTFEERQWLGRVTYWSVDGYVRIHLPASASKPRVFGAATVLLLGFYNVPILAF